MIRREANFCLSFCEALRSLEGWGGEVTVSKLVKHIKMNVECLVNISEGQEDFCDISWGTTNYNIWR